MPEKRLQFRKRPCVRDGSNKATSVGKVPERELSRRSKLSIFDSLPTWGHVATISLCKGVDIESRGGTRACVGNVPLMEFALRTQEVLVVRSNSSVGRVPTRLFAVRYLRVKGRGCGADDAQTLEPAFAKDQLTRAGQRSESAAHRVSTSPASSHVTPCQLQTSPLSQLVFDDHSGPPVDVYKARKAAAIL